MTTTTEAKSAWSRNRERSASVEPVDPQMRPAITAEEVIADKLYGNKKK